MSGRFTARRALSIGFAVGLLAPLLIRCGAWLFAGRPPSSLSETFLTRGVLPHLALAAACALLFGCLWLVRITWPPHEDAPAAPTAIWRESVAPLVLAAIVSWTLRLVRRADWDLLTVPRLNIEVDRLVIGVIISVVIGYVLGGGFRIRKQA